MGAINWTALTVFVLLFGFITWLGFMAARWKRGDLDLLHEWGLGGRRFGTLIAWFLIGGDLYTAYTFIAVPALAVRKLANGQRLLTGYLSAIGGYIVGLLASAAFDLPTGPVIVVALLLAFIATAAFRKVPV